MKAYNEWFDVAPDDLAPTTIPCRPRGRLRGTGVHVGDRVLISRLPDDEGAIEEVLPRRNRLLRPPVANADRVFVVMAWRRPDFLPELLDRILIQAFAQSLAAVIVVNKVDLAESDEEKGELDVWRSLYASAGYDVHLVSALATTGLAPLASRMRAQGVGIMAGPSGSGKSSLLSRVQPGLALRAAPVSVKTGRGRHTTRHVQLLAVGDGWMADTPGFSRLDLPTMLPMDLARAFPEFGPYLGSCRFRDCAHRTEPGCAVREAVADGQVDAKRHERYVQFLAELQVGGPKW